MCLSASSTSRRPRWRRLYGQMLAVAAVIALARAVTPRAVPDIVFGLALVGAVVGVMTRWVRANAPELDLLDWCDCASSSIRVRVVNARPRRLRPSIEDAPHPIPDRADEEVPV
jgi:hypothetical protein